MREKGIIGVAARLVRVDAEGLGTWELAGGELIVTLELAPGAPVSERELMERLAADAQWRPRIERPCPHGDTYTCACGHVLHPIDRKLPDRFGQVLENFQRLDRQ